MIPGSGADRAGLRPTRRGRGGGIVLGDLIISLDGRPVTSGADLILLLERRRQGEIVEVGVAREGRESAVPVELGPAP